MNFQREEQERLAAIERQRQLEEEQQRAILVRLFVINES